MSKKNNKRLAVQVRNDRVLLAEMKGNEASGSMMGVIPVQIVTNDAVASTLKGLLKNAKVNEIDVCMTLPESKCLSLEVDSKNLTDKEFRLNLPYEFRNYTKGAEESYVYDYQTIPQGENKQSLVYAIASSRIDIGRMKDIAEDCGLDLVRLVPEKVGLGDILALNNRDKERSCVVDIAPTKITVMVFKGRIPAALIDIQDGIGDMDVFEFNKYVMVYEDRVTNEEQLAMLEEFQPEFDRLVPKIQRLDFYKNEGLIDETTAVYAMGEGALVLPFLRQLTEETGYHFSQISDIIPGKANPIHKCLMAPAIGSALVLNK
jgi:type IV pilus assembly protein PilM